MGQAEEKAFFKTTGVVRNEKELQIDVPLPFSTNSKVKVTISIANDDDEWLISATENPALKDIFEEKDIYTLEDGKPFNG